MSPKRRRLRPLVLLSALALFPACNKDPEPAASDDKPAAPTPADDKTPAEDPPKPTPEPTPLPAQPETLADSAPVVEIGEVVATAQIPTGTAMTDLAAVANMVKPGISALATMQAPKLLEQASGVKLGGAKLSGPISMVIVDPGKHSDPVAMLVEVADGEVLSAAAAKAGRGYVERDGMALIGPTDVVEATTEFAFANLTKTPDHSELIIYPEPLMIAAEPLIAEGMAEVEREMAKQGNPAMTALIGVYGTTMRAMVAQTERLVISVSPGQTSADLVMHLYPKPDSLLAGFTAAQTAASHDLLSKLPKSTSQSIVISGELHSGPARDAMLAFLADATAKMYETDLDGQAWGALMGQWMDALDGRIAMVADASAIMQGTGAQMTMTGLMGAVDTEQMRTVWRELMAAFVKVAGDTAEAKVMGMGVSASFTADASKHDDVPIDLYETTLDVSSLPEAQRAAFKGDKNTQGMQFATFDNIGAMTSTEAGGELAGVIDAVRGKTPPFEPAGVFATMLGDSKARGESLLYFMDLSALAPAGSEPLPFAGVAAGLGRHGDAALSVRLTMVK